MKQIFYQRTGESVCRETLPNGLEIRVVPKPGFAQKYAFFATRYGGMDTRFQLGVPGPAPAQFVIILQVGIDLAVKETEVIVCVPPEAYSREVTRRGIDLVIAVIPRPGTDQRPIPGYGARSAPVVGIALQDGIGDRLHPVPEGQFVFGADLGAVRIGGFSAHRAG